MERQAFPYTSRMTSGSTFGVTSLSPGDSAPAPSNRLGVGHLLLWTATTAVVFATLVTIEERHVARFSGRNVQQNELSVRIHRAHYWLGLAVAPAYGASIAAMALASWRLMIQRPGFPTQPGHWLLIAAGVLPIAIGAAILNTASTQRLAPVMICWLGLVCLAIVVATAANFVNRPPRWSRTFRLGSWGLILIAFQLLIAAAMASGDMWFFGTCSTSCCAFR
jgi:hypothetical protein